MVFARQAAPRRRPFAAKPVIGAPIDAQTSHDELTLVRTILSHAALSPAQYRLDSLRRRVPACLRMLGAATADEALRKLRAKRQLLAPAVSTLLLGVTSFLRDQDVFDALATRVLPSLAHERPFLRIWSIGCSDGAEVLSVAMLLAELGLQKRAHILGLDVRPDAIDQAKAGLVDCSAISHLPATWQRRYFLPPTETLGPWRVNWTELPPIAWWSHDAMDLKHAGVWDMILCRNLIMYLTPASAAGLWAFILKSTRPGGVLVAGSAERPHPGTPWRSVGPCLFQNKGA